MNTPTIKILQPGDEAALESFLLPRLDSSMFLLGNMRSVGLVDNGDRLSGIYMAAYENGAIVGVMAHYRRPNLIVQAPKHLDLLLQAMLDASPYPLAGIVGPNDQVQTITQQLGLESTAFKMNETENLYSLVLNQLAVPHALASGQVHGRRIEPRDLDLLAEWRLAYSIEALGDQDTPQERERCRASVERALAEQSTWVLEVAGTPVACSSFNTRTREAVQVGGVWTPPELRNRGYARAVVAASLLDARDEGASKAILFTGAGHFAAQRAYTVLGFEHIGDYCLALLKEPLELKDK